MTINRRGLRLDGFAKELHYLHVTLGYSQEVEYNGVTRSPVDKEGSPRSLWKFHPSHGGPGEHAGFRTTRQEDDTTIMLLACMSSSCLDKTKLQNFRPTQDSQDCYSNSTLLKLKQELDQVKEELRKLKIAQGDVESSNTSKRRCAHPSLKITARKSTPSVEDS
uniref:Uncharacterized protein n=1 Tax=Oryza brachyantha TaxID=4533 RepID=J3LW40_ORYBR